MLDIDIKKNSELISELETKRQSYLYEVANLLHPDVPISDDEVNLDSVCSSCPVSTLISVLVFVESTHTKAKLVQLSVEYRISPKFSPPRGRAQNYPFSTSRARSGLLIEMHLFGMTSIS